MIKYNIQQEPHPSRHSERSEESVIRSEVSVNRIKEYHIQSEKLILTGFMILLLATLIFSCTSKEPAILNTDEIWPAITKETKPWTRWWWMGNAVNKQEIERQLTDLAEAGFGGVEITPIYGVMGYEDQYIDFLSDEWMDILQFTIEKAEELGMGVDMNLGTGWPFGGPQITPEFAASLLVTQRYAMRNGEKLNEKIAINDPKQNPEDVEMLALMAWYPDGRTEDLSDKLNNNNMLDWIPEQEVEIIAAFNAKTRQKVKRAAPGGEGWSLDHFSKEALDAYLSRFDSAFRKIEKRPRAFFNDSYEVYGSSSTKDIFEEFEARKGYNLKNYLRELDSEEDTELVRRIKSDYREVFGSLLLEEFTQPWVSWSNGQRVLTKNQAHGSPGNLIDLYGAVDIPECETFGSSYFPIPGLRRDSADIRNVDPDPVMMKFATSPANIYGKSQVSSETFTWLAEHFKVSLSQCKPELEQVFLTGVNHVFYHGTAYSPEEAEWPGWLFYASVQFGPVNSFWAHVRGLNEYIARCQSFLQQGQADSDLLVYWPIYDVWNKSGQLDMQIGIHNIDEWLHPTPFYQVSQQLMKNGYLVDFVSDKILGEISVENGMLSVGSQGGSYKTLIVPSIGLMPVATLQNILKLAERGATIIFQELPRDVPGYHELEQRREVFQELVNSLKFNNNEAIQGKGKIVLSAEIDNALVNMGIEGEELADTGLKFVRRIINGERYYFIVNLTSASVDQSVILNNAAKAVVLMDPDHGNYGKTIPKKQGDEDLVRIQLEPGQSIILRCTDMDVTRIPEWQYIASSVKSIALDGPWKLSFDHGGPVLPASVSLDELMSWTELEDEHAAYFSGSGIYEMAFQLDEDLAVEYVLDLGKVAESARVWINDREAGTLWGIPFRIRIGELIRKGENTIKIEVANLMANRIRYLDQQGIEWRNFHEINFVNIDYNPFDASGWEPMPSGLLGPVTLEIYQNE